MGSKRKTSDMVFEQIEKKIFIITSTNNCS